MINFKGIGAGKPFLQCFELTNLNTFFLILISEFSLFCLRLYNTYIRDMNPGYKKSCVHKQLAQCLLPIKNKKN